MKLKIILFTCFMCLTAIAVAQLTIHVPGDQPTIQTGIDAASNGDIVLVDEGTYEENINFKGKAITVKSHYDPNTADSSFIFNTIIDGSTATNPDSASVVYFISGEDTTSVLSGFTITGGTGTVVGADKVGGGILCYGSGPMIIHNLITDNHCSGGAHYTSGGGICSYESNQRTVIIRDNIITLNSTSNDMSGSWTCTAGGISMVVSLHKIERNIITYNTVVHTQNDQAIGGGIECYDTRAYIRNNIVKHNSCTTNSTYYKPWGGGIVCQDIDENSTICNNIISDNLLSGVYTDTKGGGLGVYRYTGKLIIDGNIVENNIAKIGGGIMLHVNDDLEFTNNVVARNISTENGGGLSVQSKSKGETHLPTRRGILRSSEQEILKGNNLAIMANNTFYDNSASTGNGNGIYYENPASLIAFNNIIYENGTGNKEIFLVGSPNVNLQTNSLDTTKIYGGSWEGKDNVIREPAFKDDSCHICDSSKCRNTGAEYIYVGGFQYKCPDYDMDGQERPDPYFNQVDIGADECYDFNPWIGETPEGLVGEILVYPNPFSGCTDIRYSISDPSAGSGQAIQYSNLSLFDVNGRLIETLVNGVQQPGEHVVRWNADGLPSGVYMYRLIVGDEVVSGKIVKR